jgi:proline iminopeptidase
MAAPRRTLYPDIEPYNSGMLPIPGSVHTIYWEECGNAHGKPVVFVHGGPGGGSSPPVRECEGSAAGNTARRSRDLSCALASWRV